MRRAAAALGAIVFICSHGAARALPPATFSSTFENNSGPTLDSTFGFGPNWTSGLNGLLPNSGGEFFESDNGNQAHDFVDERYVKQLGGVIENTAYNVAFYIAANKFGDDFQGMSLSDFSRLVVGGAGGTMAWIDAPSPVPGEGWVEWRGVYTPSAADVGTPFRFAMTVTIESRHSLAIDGPITAVPVPEPCGAALAAVAALAVVRRRPRRADV
jgi:hypothetical protein